MTVLAEKQPHSRKIDWASLAPQIQSVLETGAAGVGAYGLKKAAETLIRGALPAANILIPVAVGVIATSKELFVGHRQEKHLGVAAFKNLWEKHNGLIGRLINFPERQVGRMIIVPEKKIEAALGSEDPNSAYTVLRQVQLLTGDFKYLDKELAERARGKLEEIAKNQQEDEIIVLNKKAETAAQETYHRTVLATSLVNGVKLGLVSLVGLNASESHLQALTEKITNSETVKKILSQINGAKEHLQNMLHNNDQLKTLHQEAARLQNQLETSVGELSHKAKSLLDQIKVKDQGIAGLNHEIVSNHQNSQSIANHISNLQATKDSLHEQLITPATGFELHQPTDLPTGSGYLEALYHDAPYYTAQHGEWQTLGEAANHLADHNANFFTQGRDIAQALVDSHGHGPTEAVKSLNTFRDLNIVSPDGVVNTDQIHKIANLAIGGDQKARAQLYDLLHWFRKSSQLAIPNEVNNTIQVIQQREALQAQIDVGRQALEDLGAGAIKLKSTLGWLRSSRQQLVSSLADLHLDPTLISRLLVNQQEIAKLETANKLASSSVNDLFTALLGHSVDLSDSSKIEKALWQLNSLAITYSKLDRQSRAIRQVITAEAIATGSLLGGAALANQVSESHPDVQLHRAGFAPQGATDYFSNIQIIPITPNPS